MSALLPIMPGQLERWSAPRPEPVTLELAGWKVETHGPDATFPNQRWVRFERGGASIELMRYWDNPRSPGYPMAVDSQKQVTVSGQVTEFLTTSMFNGIAKQVKVCWLRGKGHGVEYGVRIVFEGCSDEEIEDALGRVVVAW